MKIAAYTNANITAILSRIPADLESNTEWMQCRTKEEWNAQAPDTEILLATGKMSAEMLMQAPRLKWIQTLSAGVDGLPLAYIQERGIRLTNARGIHQIQMSEFALLQMLQWARRADLHYRNQIQHVWGKNVPVGELFGHTVGVIGSGSIGQAIARLCKAFGMQTLGYNRSGKPAAHFDEMLGGTEGLNQLLAESDYVILLLPSTPETRQFLTMEQFKRMKPTACLINLARGTVLNEEHLIEALRTGVIAGASLDVFETEPLPPSSPLWELPNAILTPHVSGLSPHYMARASEIVFENLRNYLEGTPLRNEVDLLSGY